MKNKQTSLLKSEMKITAASFERRFVFLKGYKRPALLFVLTYCITNAKNVKGLQNANKCAIWGVNV